MSAPVRILDPRPVRATERLPNAPRPETLDGVTLGLVHNGKTHGMELMELVADELRKRWDIAGVKRLRKAIGAPLTDAHYQKVASERLAVLAAIGD